MVIAYPPLPSVAQPQTHGINNSRAAVAVIPGIYNVLEIGGNLNIFSDLETIIGFQYLFQAVVQFPVTYQHAKASVLKIIPVVRRQTVKCIGNSQMVFGTLPMYSA